MRDRSTFDAWLVYTKETLRLSRAATTDGDYSAVSLRDAEGQRLWEACLLDGWTPQEGDQALRQSLALREVRSTAITSE